MNNNWRFIETKKLNAIENMDYDKSLLDNFQDEPIFRLYTWNENSFTIGRSQKIEDIPNAQNFGGNYAKRETGGGLLLHGFDISYTILIPPKLLGKKSVKESYEYLCSFLLHFYRSLGLHVEYAKDLHVTLSKSAFCQVGFEPYDIICQGKKIGGNAQRRKKDVIHQHGSIPLYKDKRTYSGYSLEDFAIKLSEEEAKKLLKKSFIECFKVKFNN